MNRYYNLLKTWCDRLISLQITEMKDKHFHGGILCPACSLIHGRIGDAVYPFVLLYDKTRDKKYLDAAKLVVEWSEYNVLRSEGGYFNDKNNAWKGITVFSAIAMGDALLYHGNCLEREIFSKWMTIFERFIEFIYIYFDSDGFQPNINYPAAEIQAMALAYVLLGKEKYKEKAYEKAAFLKKYFNEDDLLFGEGAHNVKTPKNCTFVDIGYNVEESLPSLAVFAYLMKDEEYMQFCVEKFKAHVEFMMPDGAWDNSWGTRADKWTYWGSRTSDGAQAGLCLLAEYNPIFAEAAQRNFELYEKCSRDGFLYGGKMYIEAGEEPCVHHTFCHAKALCSMIDYGFEYKEKTLLPREREYGLKKFPTVHVSLISKGDWRATISDSDAVMRGSGKATSGGTITLLWNKKIFGPVFAATMAKYSLGEPTNMQCSRHYDRIENCALRISDGVYESVNDIYASVFAEENKQGIKATVSGILRNINFEGESAYELKYLFEDDRLTVTAKCEKDCILKLPIICSGKDNVVLSDNKLEINREGAQIILSSEQKLELEHPIVQRRFHVIGGFQTLGVYVKLKAEVPVKVIVKI